MNDLRPGIIYWVIIDRATGEWVMRCDTRAEARALAGAVALVAKVVVCR